LKAKIALPCLMASARSASLDDSDEEMASKAADEGNASGKFGSADVGWAGIGAGSGKRGRDGGGNMYHSSETWWAW